jgi:hypothetical protein
VSETQERLSMEAVELNRLLELGVILFSFPIIFGIATTIKFYSGYAEMENVNGSEKSKWFLDLVFPTEITFQQYLVLVIPFTNLSGKGFKTRLIASIVQVVCIVGPFLLPFIIIS